MRKFVTVNCDCGYDYEIEYQHETQLYAAGLKAKCPKCQAQHKFKQVNKYEQRQHAAEQGTDELSRTGG